MLKAPVGLPVRAFDVTAGEYGSDDVSRPASSTHIENIRINNNLNYGLLDEFNKV
jgi:hypothetical protein